MGTDLRRRLGAAGAFVLSLLIALAFGRAASAQACGEGSRAELEAAALNTLTLDTFDIDLFGRPEHGWRLYAPRIGADLGTACIPESPVFAARLRAWQASRGLPADGIMHADTLQALKAAWQAQRPFMAARTEGVCPAPPPDAEVVLVPAEDEVQGTSATNPPRLQAGALAALQRMRAAARADLPDMARDPEILALFSGYRSPAYDAARCAREGNCNGVVRAACSAHRTGRAMDLFVGALPGYTADGSADVNRLHQTQGEAYGWLLRNAGGFGFVNYVFEPWHWEWTGP